MRGSGSCVFGDKGIPFELPALLKPLEPLAQAAQPGLCSVPDVISVCISPAIVLLLRQGWGLQYPLLLLLLSCPWLLPSPASLHPRRATSLPCRTGFFKSSSLVFGAVRDPAFSITWENTGAYKRRIWQLDTA